MSKRLKRSQQKRSKSLSSKILSKHRSKITPVVRFSPKFHHSILKLATSPKKLYSMKLL
jgi:hypothetical protein